jgi:hypothetical protein
VKPLRSFLAIAAVLVGLLGFAGPAQAQQAPQSCVWTSATPTDTRCTVTTLGYGLASISFSPSGSFTGGTFNFEVGTDSACSDFYSTYAVASVGTQSVSTFALTSVKTLWTVPVPASNCLSVRINPAISGSGTATLRLNVYPGAGPPPFQPAAAASTTVNLNQVAGIATVTGGVAGLVGVGGNGADNTAITGNPIAEAGRAQAMGTLKAFGTSGNQVIPATDLVGDQFVRLGSSVVWACDLAGVGTTLTQCQAAPGTGSLYVTDLLVDSTTATGGTYVLKYGTGANCGTGTTTLWPVNWTPTAPVLGQPQKIVFQTPLQVPAGNALCVLGVVTNTTNAALGGFTGP